MSAPLLETRGISKRFGPVEALSEVSLTILPGRVHTLLGENGAGKSTLMKILAGVYAPTSGEVLIDGKQVTFHSPEDSRSKGVAIIFQELSLSSNRTVAENIYANHEPRRFGVINDRQLRADAGKLLSKLGIPINAEELVGSLSMAQRQLVEIAKALSTPARIVIMDEPTSSLSNEEEQNLMRIIKSLKEEGKAIIYISHRMEEIMRVSDDISILRDGRYIRTVRRDETNLNELIALMVGREMRDIYPPRLEAAFEDARPPVLRVSELHAPGVFENVSFSVSRGQVLGFFGLIGAGRSEVMKALFGMQSAAGTIEIDGKPVRIRKPIDAIRHGIGFVTENRKEEGLSLQHSVERNINCVNFSGLANRFGILRQAEEAQRADAAVRLIDIKTASNDEPVGNLSGGNQQKVVFSKWLEVRPRLLILDEPTRGVDVGAKYEIYRVIRELAANGTAILLVSSELPEALAMSDQLIVMREGRFVKTVETAGLTQEMVMTFAAGATYDNN
jgi:ribose transport system ATP-binding protein